LAPGLHFAQSIKDYYFDRAIRFLNQTLGIIAPFTVKTEMEGEVEQFTWEEISEILDVNNTGNNTPVRNDVNLGSTSAVAATNEMVPYVVKTEQPFAAAGQVIPDQLNIRLHPTDPTKSVLPDEDEGLYMVRNNSNLQLELFPSMVVGMKPRIKIWVTYRNLSYQHPVKIQDEEVKAGANSVSSLAVFALIKADTTTNIEWYYGSQGEIVADISNYQLLPFIKFTSVSSEVKKGNGWILNVSAEFDQTIIAGKVGVKSLKIIRSKTAGGGIKRKRMSSTCSGAILPPSPISSEDGSDREESITAMTKEELQQALQHYHEMAQLIAQELFKR